MQLALLIIALLALLIVGVLGFALMRASQAADDQMDRIERWITEHPQEFQQMLSRLRVDYEAPCHCLDELEPAALADRRWGPMEG